METINQSNEHHIGDLIKLSLKKHSISMRKLSSLCSMDTATISRIVNGKQKPKLIHLEQFSQHLNIPLDKLMKATGYEVGNEKKGNMLDILNSLDAIRDILENSKLFDPQVTIIRIEQELAKYEQYALTEEGNRMINQEFNTKVMQVNGVGPFIEHLKEMHSQYCDTTTSIHERSLLGSALLYFILSADIIPDYIFPIGYLDDAIAVHLVLDRLKNEEKKV